MLSAFCRAFAWYMSSRCTAPHQPTPCGWAALVEAFPPVIGVKEPFLLQLPESGGDLFPCQDAWTWCCLRPRVLSWMCLVQWRTADGGLVAEPLD